MNSIAARRKKRKTLTLENGATNKRTGETLTSEATVVTSDEQMEAHMIIEDLAYAYKRTLEFYRQHCNLSPEEARKHADGNDHDIKLARERPVREITWHNMSAVAERDMSEALKMWERIQFAAARDFESGNYLEEVTGHGSPLEKARLLHIRDAFMDSWQPRNAIEQVMVDTLVEAYILFQYWMGVSHQRAVYIHEKQEREIKRFEAAKWKSPFQSEADGIDQAQRLADSHNRMFLHTLRQMRDLRRYTVVIQNPNQVNIGEQQINVSKT
jgi:hypothetical protein